MSLLDEKRERYNDETYRTLPLIEGKTIDATFTNVSIETGEVTGLRIRFTDGTEVSLTTPDNTPLDVARSTGLYKPEPYRISQEAVERVAANDWNLR